MSEVRERRIVIEKCHVDEQRALPVVSVTLRLGDRSEEVGVQAERPEDYRMEVAEATCSCLQRLLPGCQVDVPNVYVCGSLGVPEIVTAHIRLRLPEQAERWLVGAAPIGADRARSVANAVMDAVNRPLALWLQIAIPHGLGTVHGLTGRSGVLSGEAPRESGPLP
jgi:hypothetical protein